MESRKREDEKRRVGEEMCGKEARRRAVERCGNEESRRAVARRRGQKL